MSRGRDDWTPELEPQGGSLSRSSGSGGEETLGTPSESNDVRESVRADRAVTLRG